MHPVLAQRGAIPLYLGLWALLAALLTLLLSILGGGSLLQAAAIAAFLAVIYSFVSLATYYPCRAMPLTTTPLSRVAIAHGVAALSTSAVWTGVGGLWATLVDRVLGLSGTRDLYVRQTPTVFVLGVLLYLLAAAAHYLAAALAASREAENRALELRVLAREAELRALRAQIDPHFLFNSLNSISALAASDPAAARDMCQRLSQFLRVTLHLGARDRISLAEEWSLLENFLAIERVRFGNRLRIDARLDEDARACLVPPLVLQPLVENAIRHGVAHLVEGGTVTVRAACENGLLRIEVENPVDPERRLARGSGMGIANVRDRLAALFASDARFTIETEPGRFRSRIELPAERPAAVPAAATTEPAA